jgi:hypothetical protein|tara:strand:+ start:16 stop:522 length:507 start_codon:yes stop_codon:yes gene_type:complete
MIDHYIYEVPNFVEHKKNLIDKILKIPNNPLIMDNGESLQHTDWNLPKKMQREYLNYFNSEILPNFASNFCNTTNSKEIGISKVWFQVYGKGDSHDKHNHPGCHFTNVFYIKLPNNLKTKIKTFTENLETEISEGNILTFPACYFHFSPKNTSEDEKIIIAFNLDIIK